MLLAISVPVTAVISSVLTVLVMYFHCERKTGKLKSLSTASAEPCETSVSVQATRFDHEMKDNAAYGHVNYIYKPDAIYDTVNDK